MVTDNERLLRQLYELFNRGDLEGLLEHFDAAIEWDWSRSLGPDSGVWRGRAGVRSFAERNWEAWEEIRMEPEEFVEAGDEVVVFVHVRVRGRDGIEVEARGPHVVTLKDGKIIRYELFQEPEEALAAVAARREAASEARPPSGEQTPGSPAPG